MCSTKDSYTTDLLKINKSLLMICFRQHPSFIPKKGDTLASPFQTKVAHKPQTEGQVSQIKLVLTHCSINDKKNNKQRQ